MYTKVNTPSIQLFGNAAVPWSGHYLRAGGQILGGHPIMGPDTTPACNDQGANALLRNGVKNNDDHHRQDKRRREKARTVAQTSRYGRTVAITATTCVRCMIDDIYTISGSGDFCGDRLSTLNELHAKHSDPDGIHTNGKGVLGSLIGDIKIVSICHFAAFRIPGHDYSRDG